jgi:branched-subunit amino acid transport protein
MNDGNELYYWAAVGVLTLCSLITRSTYIVFGRHLPLSDGVRRALRYAPVAALTAIVVPDLLPWRAGVGPVLDIKLLAGIVGGLMFLFVRNTVLVIVAGMAALWGLRWLAG